MEKNNDSIEQPYDVLTPRERKFGNKVIQKILNGDEAAVLNPRLWGLGGYRREEIYPYIQAGLEEQGVVTTVAESPMESGSEAPIAKHTLTVVSRIK